MAAMGQELLAIAGGAGRVCVGLVFLLAAAQKFSHWRILSGVVANYRLLPAGLVGPVSALLPPAEMILALLLLTGVAQYGAAMAAIALLVLFAAAMGINLRRGRAHIDCGCGQSFLQQTLRWTLIARNAVLVAMLLPSLTQTAPMTLSAMLTSVSAGAGFFLLYLLFNTLSALPPARARTHRFA